MAHGKAHTSLVHDDPNVQREFERVSKQKAAASIVQPAPQAETPNAIILTSEDASIDINKYDLSVWNFQCKYEFIHNDELPPYDTIELDTNRNYLGGHIPFTADQAVIEDTRGYCTWNAEADTIISSDNDPDYISDVNKKRIVFAPSKSGTYLFDAQVIIKYHHYRELVEYYDAITRGILYMVKLDKAEFETFATGPNYYTPFETKLDGTPPIYSETRNDFYDIFDLQIKINESAVSGIEAVHPEILQLNFVNVIDLNGSFTAYVNEGEVCLFYYKFDTYHLYNDGGWVVQQDTVAGIQTLYEAISISFQGIEGDDSLAIDTRIKNIIKNINN